MRSFYYLFACCLFMAQIHENVADKVTSTPRSRPLLNLQTRLREILDEFNSAAADVQTSTTTANKDSIANKLTAIGGNLQGLNEELANIIRSKSGKQSSKNSPLKPKKQNENIIAAIRNKKFELAQEKLRKVNNKNDVAIIIRAVYGNNLDKFELLANFIESLTDIDLIYISVNALRKEMLESDDKNPSNWIRLVKILETKFLSPSEVDYFIVQFGQFTYEALKNSIRLFTLEALKSALSKGTFERNGEIDNCTSAVYSSDPMQWGSIFYEFVNSNMQNASKILEIITSHRFMEQKVEGVNTLYWSMVFNDDQRSDVIINIASLLKEFKSDRDFEKLDASQKDLVEKIIENLPSCARNLFFLPSVCFWNNETGLYLTAALDGSLNYDDMQRPIVSSDLLPESHWYISKQMDNNLVISSAAYDKEVLYSSQKKFNPNLRFVFNGISEDSNKEIEELSKWTVELENDLCYVKSAKYNEYLSTSGHFLENNLRQVFTGLPKNISKEPQFHWQVRSCD